MENQTSQKRTAFVEIPGIAAAIEEIERRNASFERGERILAAKLKPPQPALENLSHRNCEAASDAIISEIRAELDS